LDLWDAALKGDIDRLKIAIRNGGNPDFYHKKEEGCPTSLHAAARVQNADSKCTMELIKKGADINAVLVSNFNSPLHEGKTSNLYLILKTKTSHFINVKSC